MKNQKTDYNKALEITKKLNTNIMETYAEDFLNLFPWMQNASPRLLLKTFWGYLNKDEEIIKLCNAEKERQIGYELNLVIDKETAIEFCKLLEKDIADATIDKAE